jgi:hypothetical protein
MSNRVGASITDPRRRVARPARHLGMSDRPNQSTTENTAMLIDINTDQSFSDDKDAYYEAVASQEEIYLEETEEEVRSILISDSLPEAQLNG